MTVEAFNNSISHIGDGVQDSFVYDFYVADISHMVIYFDGVVQSVPFTMTGLDDPAGGTVDFTTPPADTVDVTLLRSLPLTQETKYRTYGRFPGPVIEGDFDYQTYINQQLQEQINRCIIVPVNADIVDYEDIFTARDEASASAAAAAISETNATASEINAAASEASANADAAATAIDAAATAADAVATAADAAATAIDAAATAADAVATAADAAATAADAISTDADATSADADAIAAAASAAAAAISAADAENRVPKTSDTGSAEIPTGDTSERDAVPTAGYFRFNEDLVSFEGYNGSAWGSVGGGASGGVNNPVFYENDTNVTEDYEISTGKNAMSAGPITIDTGVTVTVPTGSVWTIV